MFGFPFSFSPGYSYGNTFEARYRARPLAFIDKQSAEYGDKVILPPTALDMLARLHIEYPMLFKVECVQSKRHTHCGVLEFIAEEGYVYLPQWMMQNLLLDVGDMVTFKNVSLPKGSFVKLQPVTSDFLDISNPKAVLERSLRGYTCLTVGDCFVINYNNKIYEIEVKEAKPQRAISVVETDCQVDFEAPKDYKEPEPVWPSKPEPKADTSQDGKAAPSAGPAGASASNAKEPEPEPESPTFLAFAGSGRRLDGRPSAPSVPVSVVIRGPLNTPAPELAPVTESPSNGAAGGKTGTFVGFGGLPGGNRLLAKLEREKKQQGGPTSAPAPEPTKEDEDSKFKAFEGKKYSLK